MRELVQNAWLGWRQYTDQGKIAALLLAVLLFLWLGKRKERKERGEHGKPRILLFYTACMTALCICPLTAALLMAYQTRFYNYEWIWSLVPVTPVIAYGGTVFLAQIWESYGKKEGMVNGAGFLKPAFLTACLIALLFLCGSPGKPDWQKAGERLGDQSWETEQPEEKKERIRAALEAVSEGEEPVCLWAPAEVMDEARRYSGAILLPYGRNLWDNALNAYSYEICGEDVQSMYRWMCETEAICPEELLAEYARPTKEEKAKWQQEAAKNLETAMEKGVNRILIPGYLDQEYITKLEEILGIQGRKIEGYYLFCL